MKQPDAIPITSSIQRASPSKAVKCSLNFYSKIAWKYTKTATAQSWHFSDTKRSNSVVPLLQLGCLCQHGGIRVMGRDKNTIPQHSLYGQAFVREDRERTSTSRARVSTQLPWVSSPSLRTQACLHWHSTQRQLLSSQMPPQFCLFFS